MENARQRKRFYVDPVVQGALLRRLMLHWLYVLVALFTCLLIGQVLSSGADNTLREHLLAMWQKYGMLLVVLLCLFPAFAYDSVKLSNRFAGPVFSLRQALKKLGDGQDIPPLSFRKGDYWTEMAGDLNRVAQRLRTQSAQRAAESREEVVRSS